METTQLTVYDKIGNMAEITQFGHAIAASGLFGCNRPEQGQVFAIQCMFERKPPLEMAKTYHVVGSKLVKRADAMLADFRRAGGKWKWANLDDGERQSANVAWEGEQYQVAYSMDQARAAGLVKEGSNWVKDSPTMLRARLVSRTLRAIAPEIVQGVYTDADLDDAPTPVARSNEPTNVTPIERAQAAVDKQSAAKVVEATVVDDRKPLTRSVADDPFTSGDADAGVIDYTIIPIGPNAGKTWMDLDKPTLERVLANPRTLSDGHILAVQDAIARQPF
jgi:hypothetical protein